MPPRIPSPFDACLREATSAKAGGRARVGVDATKTLGPPSPSSPPTVGRGDFWKNMSNQLWTP